MSAPVASDPRPLLTWQGVVLAGTIVLFGTTSLFPAGILIGLAGFLSTAALRRSDRTPDSMLPFLPLVTALTLVVVASASSPTDDLLAGITGLAVLVWLSDEPTHPLGGTGRGSKVFLLSALAVLTAWAASLLKISLVAGTGLAVGLIALALLVVASLLARLPLAPVKRSEESEGTDLDSALGVGDLGTRN